MIKHPAIRDLTVQSNRFNPINDNCTSIFAHQQLQDDMHAIEEDMRVLHEDQMLQVLLAALRTAPSANIIPKPMPAAVGLCFTRALALLHLH